MPFPQLGLVAVLLLLVVLLEEAIREEELSVPEELTAVDVDEEVSLEALLACALDEAGVALLLTTAADDEEPNEDALCDEDCAMDALLDPCDDECALDEPPLEEAFPDDDEEDDEDDEELELLPPVQAASEIPVQRMRSRHHAPCVKFMGLRLPQA